MNFTTLPTELLQKISDETSSADSKSLRLVCKAFAALLQKDLLHSLLIHINGQTPTAHRGLDILEHLANTREHAARCATQELVIDYIESPPLAQDPDIKITLEEFEARWKASLVPALQSLTSVKKLRFRFGFTKSDEIFTAVIGYIKSIIPRLRILEVYAIDSSPCYSTRLEETLSILNDPQLHDLTSFSLDTEGGAEVNDALVASLISVAANIVKTSRTSLERFKFNIPVLNGWSALSPPRTLQNLFGQNTSESLRALTHLTLDNTTISDIRSRTPTLPQLSSLTHLSCPEPSNLHPPNAPPTNLNLPHASHNYRFGFWTALANTPVPLRSLRHATASPEMLAYLCSYSGELQELDISCYHTPGANAVEEAMGIDLWDRVVQHHQPSLRVLRVSSDCEGWGMLGAQTPEDFRRQSPDPFPELQELEPSVLPHGYMGLILNLIFQPKLFPSLQQLLVKFPYRPDAGSSRFGVRNMRREIYITDIGTETIMAHKFTFPRTPLNSSPGPSAPGHKELNQVQTWPQPSESTSTPAAVAPIKELHLPDVAVLQSQVSRNRRSAGVCTFVLDC
ncbi:hypothetical protein FA15DRAFT_760238 [Coprinopsis marcescibilis]|uniref:F-box domain-containing protein n=1 Tax=Coprinopsis marcescibilis TaxID=230819 RepID=A0A5C3KGG9_COPMA|nr:hypothetical protein FA15DRAFT_760238 [Coprinopsis marcescibilis]